MHQEFVVLASTVLPVKYCFVLRVNQTAGTLGTQKTELVYASINLCLDIIKTFMLCIVLALVIVGQCDHNLFQYIFYIATGICILIFHTFSSILN